MTTTEPRVLITAIKCQKCGAEITRGVRYRDGSQIDFPYETTIAHARTLASRWTHGTECDACGGRSFIVTEPIPSAARLSGGFGWMSTVGHGDLDEFLE